MHTGAARVEAAAVRDLHPLDRRGHAERTALHEEGEECPHLHRGRRLRRRGQELPDRDPDARRGSRPVPPTRARARPGAEPTAIPSPAGTVWPGGDLDDGGLAPGRGAAASWPRGPANPRRRSPRFHPPGGRRRPRRATSPPTASSTRTAPSASCPLLAHVLEQHLAGVPLDLRLAQHRGASRRRRSRQVPSSSRSSASTVWPGLTRAVRARSSAARLP